MLFLLKTLITGNCEMETDSNATTITINVKFNGVTIPISISPNSTIKDLKSLLLPSTNVLPRGQKLIFKGKILEDPMTLTASNLTNGSKLMLVASQGLYQGDGPILKKAQVVPKYRKDSHSGSSNDVKKIPVKNRMERWKATGVVALSESNLEVPVSLLTSVLLTVKPSISLATYCANKNMSSVGYESGNSNSSSSMLELIIEIIAERPIIMLTSPLELTIAYIGCSDNMLCALVNLEKKGEEVFKQPTKEKAIPEEVWVCGSSARVLDCNNNSIKNVPVEVAHLTGLEKLFMNSNEIKDESIRWEGLTTLKYITVLSLNHNNLTTLPSALGSLTSLKELHVSNNKLGGFPDEIGHLTKLEVLRANNNRISITSDSIGNCHSLVEVDLSSNFLSELPETFSSLSNLKALYLSNNGMKSLPSKLFKTCLQLSTLDLHNTEITIDILRQFEGWDDFDKRRRSKHQKQIDFRVGVSRDFDEGADKS